MCFIAHMGQGTMGQGTVPCEMGQGTVPCPKMKNQIKTHHQGTRNHLPRALFFTLSRLPPSVFIKQAPVRCCGRALISLQSTIGKNGLNVLYIYLKFSRKKSFDALTIGISYKTDFIRFVWHFEKSIGNRKKKNVIFYENEIDSLPFCLGYFFRFLVRFELHSRCRH